MTTAPESMRAALARAQASGARGDAESSVADASLALNHAQELGDTAAQAEAHMLLVLQLFRLGRLADSLRHSHLAWDAYRSLGRYEQACEVRLRMALTLSEIGAHERALQLSRLAFDEAQGRGLDAPLRHALTMMGGLQGRIGNQEEAEVLLLQALSRSRDAGDVANELTTLNALLCVLTDELAARRLGGEAEHVAAVSRRLLNATRLALARCSEDPQPFRRAVVLGNTATALAACGRFDDAMEVLSSAIAQSAEGNFWLVEMRNRVRMAEIWLDQEEADLADAEIGRIEALLTREPHQGAATDVLSLRERVARLRGDGDAAERWSAALVAARSGEEERLQRMRAQLAADAQEVAAQLMPVMRPAVR